MSNKLGRKIRKGQTLIRVRQIYQQTAQAEACRAAAVVEAKNDRVTMVTRELSDLESNFSRRAQTGVSAKSFMQFHSLRQMHVQAVELAEQEVGHANDTLNDSQEALQLAATDRRAADRLMEMMVARQGVHNRRTEQKITDDTNCTRAARGGE